MLCEDKEDLILDAAENKMAGSFLPAPGGKEGAKRTGLFSGHPSQFCGDFAQNLPLRGGGKGHRRDSMSSKWRIVCQFRAVAAPKTLGIRAAGFESRTLWRQRR